MQLRRAMQLRRPNSIQVGEGHRWPNADPGAERKITLRRCNSDENYFPQDFSCLQEFSWLLSECCICFALCVSEGQSNFLPVFFEKVRRQISRVACGGSGGCFLWKTLPPRAPDLCCPHLSCCICNIYSNITWNIEDICFLENRLIVDLNKQSCIYLFLRKSQSHKKTLGTLKKPTDTRMPAGLKSLRLPRAQFMISLLGWFHVCVFFSNALGCSGGGACKYAGT